MKGEGGAKEGNGVVMVEVDGCVPHLDVGGVGGAGEVGVDLLEVTLGVPAPGHGLQTPA